ncbi:Uncharacterised protein [Serratia fonticola]|uniref:Uncharacterized protein n=1 Tax=Serratia fonticola TaxID=47917 RepID=A0A4U9UDE1_SERFO|nr:Uncharacterised protein [Serratia fonticola]
MMCLFSIKIFVSPGTLLHFSVVRQVGHHNRGRFDLLHGLRNQPQIYLRAVDQLIQLGNFIAHPLNELGIARFVVQRQGRL